MAAWLRWFNASLGQIDGVARAVLAHQVAAAADDDGRAGGGLA